MDLSMIDTLKVLGRIISIIPWLLIVTLIMGKRSVGEVPVFDFLIIIVLGAVAGADIADPSIPHIYTFIAIAAIGALQLIVTKLKINNRKFGRMITFEPTVVIQNGTFQVDNLQQIRYSIDNVLQMLREKEIFNVNDVELAIVEANGKLTVYKKPAKSNVTIEDLGIMKASGGLAYPVIMDGEIEFDTLNQLKLDVHWLIQKLKREGLEVQDIFFASVTDNHDFHFSPLNNAKSKKPDISH